MRGCIGTRIWDRFWAGVAYEEIMEGLEASLQLASMRCTLRLAVVCDRLPFPTQDSELVQDQPAGSSRGAAGNVLITCGGEQQWPGKSSNLLWLRYAQRVGLAAEPPGGPARPVATITWWRVGRKSLDADTPHGG